MRFDPFYIVAGTTFADGGRTVAISSLLARSAVVQRKFKGKWYFEIKLNAGSGLGLGVQACDPTILASKTGLDVVDQWLISETNTLYIKGASSSPYTAGTYTLNDIIMVAVDLDNSKIYFGRNGTWLGTSDPATSTAPADSTVTSTYGIIPCVTGYTGINVNATINLTAAQQSFAAPSGFTAWGDASRTLDAKNASQYATLSNGNRTIANSNGANYAGAFCDTPIAGKAYFECTFDSPGTAGRIGLGIAANLSTSDTYASFTKFTDTGGATDDRISVSDDGYVRERGTIRYTGSSFGASDVCMFAVDIVTGKVWVGKNGTWWNSGDPAAGTNPLYTMSSNLTRTFKAGMVANTLGTWQGTVNFGSTPPAYEPPTGFSMMGGHFASFDAAVAVVAPLSFVRQSFRSFDAAVAVAAPFARTRDSDRSFDAAVSVVAPFARTRYVYAAFDAAVGVAAAMTARGVFQAFMDAALAIVTTLDDNLEYIGWVANMDTGAHSTYTGFDFDSFINYQDQTWGARGDGIYLLEGADDAGTTIPGATIRLPLSNLGAINKKRVPVAYLAVLANGRLALKVIDDGREYIYESEVRNGGMDMARVKLGRGLDLTYWQFELSNMTATDFELEAISTVEVNLQRIVNK